MAHKETLATLEDKIGLKPRQKNHDEVLTRISYNTLAQRPLFIAWMILNGITTRTANAAMNPSLAKAYAIPNYLATWRSRDNPAFAVMNNFLDDEDVTQEEAEAPIPRAAGERPSGNSEPTDITTDTAERMASAVAPLIKRLVTGEVADQLKQAANKLELSEDAKAKVRAIAKEAAETQAEHFGHNIMAQVQAELERRIPPQEIRVLNVTSGTAVNVGIQHESFPKLLRACQARNSSGHRLNIWLTGPTGSGKTTAAENCAKALGLAFGSDGSLDADYKVYGFRNASGEYQRTTFREIFEHGGIYVADEIDNWHQSALLALNAPLANGWASFPDGMIKRHPDCIVIACANTWGLGATNDYVGRSKLDAASLDRFQPKINWPVDERLELAIAKQTAGALGQLWCEFVQGARARAKALGLKIIISPRATINGLALMDAGFDWQEAMDQTFLAGLDPTQVRNLNLVISPQVERLLRSSQPQAEEVEFGLTEELGRYSARDATSDFDEVLRETTDAQRSF